MHLRLGVNIDHVATLRNARGGTHPDTLRAAQVAKAAGADGITVHLREDRRHIRDADVERLMQEIDLPINLEMAATPEMQAIALRLKPHAVCLVPEKRHELTTEGGLDVTAQAEALKTYIVPLAEAGMRVSLFVDPVFAQADAARAIGAHVIELHTGSYAHAEGWQAEAEMKRLQTTAHHAHALGLEVHAGHGLTYANVGPVAAITEIRELNIGHFLMGEALFVGLEQAIRTMRAQMDGARKAHAA